jgi:caffeoyl-CoA O-methyltransferase
VSGVSKDLRLSAALHGYIVAHGTPPDALLRELADTTRSRIGDLAIMQVAPEQGAFLTLLTRLMGARRAIEVGTFTGYSALCIARGLPEDGKLLCCDVKRDWTDVGRPFWERAGVAHKIELRIAPAHQTLRALPPDADWDLAFIDADKQGYEAYYEELLPRLRPGGVVLVDNVLWGGSVVDPARDDDDTNAIRRFNDRVAADPRVDCVMLPIADGLTLLRKR